jgi:hypothetical protein
MATERVRPVSAVRFSLPPFAECEQCDRLHPEATRQRARLHVRQTGHTVRYTVEDVTKYKPEKGDR